MGRQISVAALWRGLLAAGSRPSGFVPPILGDGSARFRLSRICHRLNGVRALVVTLAEGITVPPLVVRAVEHRMTAGDLVELEELRKGLDDIRAPRWWAAEASDPHTTPHQASP